MLACGGTTSRTPRAFGGSASAVAEAEALIREARRFVVLAGTKAGLLVQVNYRHLALWNPGAAPDSTLGWVPNRGGQDFWSSRTPCCEYEVLAPIDR